MIIQVIALVLSWQVAHFGGNLNNGSNDGLWNANFNNSSGNSNANIESQLRLKDNNDAITLSLDKKTNALYTDVSSHKRKLQVFQADMKRKGNLYTEVCIIDNIQQAYQKAKKGKRHYREVIKIEKNPDKYLADLQRMLKAESYINSKYYVFKRNTGHKIREIYRLPFYPDRVVHHCIVQVCQPIWYKLFIRDTFSTIPGRGIHDGVKRVKRALKDKENTQYCLKLDIRKFYPSVDHQILKNIIKKKIKDDQLTDLLSIIIDSAPGIPIGNYVSQWLGNLYLAYFDHYVKEKLGVKYYFRYCDDLVLLSDNKQQLWKLKTKIEQYLKNNLQLKLKGNYKVFPVSQGIDFLGYRFFHDYTLVRKSIVKAFKKKAGKEKVTKQTQSAYWGWFKHADTFNLTQKYFNNENRK